MEHIKVNGIEREFGENDQEFYTFACAVDPFWIQHLEVTVGTDRMHQQVGKLLMSKIYQASAEKWQRPE